MRWLLIALAMLPTAAAASEERIDLPTRSGIVQPVYANFAGQPSRLPEATEPATILDKSEDTECPHAHPTSPSSAPV